MVTVLPPSFDVEVARLPHAAAVTDRVRATATTAINFGTCLPRRTLLPSYSNDGPPPACGRRETRSGPDR
ncbi:hypothetical protein GCM10022220_45640 [Actinocatenispora rupis]